MRRDAGGDDAVAHIIDIGQPQMFGRRDVAEKSVPVADGDRAADRAGNMVVAGRDVAGQRPEHIEGRAAAYAFFKFHVGFDLIERHMARAFDHHLHAEFARALGQLAQHQQLRQLSTIGGVAGAPDAARRRARSSRHARADSRRPRRNVRRADSRCRCARSMPRAARRRATRCPRSADGRAACSRSRA